MKRIKLLFSTTILLVLVICLSLPFMLAFSSSAYAVVVTEGTACRGLWPTGGNGDADNGFWVNPGDNNSDRRMNCSIKKKKGFAGGVTENITSCKILTENDGNIDGRPIDHISKKRCKNP